MTPPDSNAWDGDPAGESRPLAGIQRLAASLDVGGTFTKGALVADDGQILRRCQVPSDHQATGGEIAAHLAGTVHYLLAGAGLSTGCLAGVAVSVPGVIDRRTDRVVSCPNLQNWDGLPVGRMTAEALGMPVTLENDANLAAVGERWLGAATGCENVICITLGTGVGCGIIADGRLYRGATGGAGEFGHVIVEKDGRRCTCGAPGCLEAYVSGWALAAHARAAVAAGASGRMLSLAGGDPQAITPEIIFRAAAGGDMTAAVIVREALDWLGTALATLVNLLNPDIIVIGGGIADAGEQVMAPLRLAVSRCGRASMAEYVRLERAHLGNDAGVIGGAYLVFQNIGGAA